MAKPFLSVVVPCFNEEEVLPEFHRRMTNVCRDLDVPYEIVLVNDGSRDGTWETMLQMGRTDPHVVCVNLARNHGQALALSAGLSVCQGQRVHVIDVDLQDPPELLPDMMLRMDEGVDVVYGQRRRRAGESWLKLATASLFYRTISKLANVPIPVDTGDFRLMSRRVVDVLLAMPERHRFVRGMVSWIGFRQESLPYNREARFAGETKWPMRKLWRLAIDAITSFSMKPLQFAGIAGMITVLLGLGLLTAGVVPLLAGGAIDGMLLLAGWMTLIGGTQLLSQGILGEYVGRLSEQSKGRPLFLIDSVLRFDAAGQRIGNTKEDEEEALQSYRWNEKQNV